PTLAAAVAPLCAEDDEVVGPHRLHLAPRLAAAARAVEGRGVLHDDAFVTRTERLVEDALGGLRIRGHDRRDLEVRRDRLEPPGALLERRVEEVDAVDVED